MGLNVSGVGLSQNYSIQNNNLKQNKNVDETSQLQNTPFVPDNTMNNLNTNQSIKSTPIPSSVVGAASIDPAAKSQMQMAINTGNVELAKKIVAEMMDRLKSVQELQDKQSFNKSLMKSDVHINITV
jgi:hypothetical protein